MKNDYIFEYRGYLTSKERSKYSGLNGVTLWLTGLSGSGKSTLASYLENKILQDTGHPTYCLDGDNLRATISSDLGFSEEDRKINVIRAGYICTILNEAGVIAIASLVSPFASHRNIVRDLHKERDLRFYEIYISTPLAVCKSRDQKGLYQMENEGKVLKLTGVSQIYEPPSSPDLEFSLITQSDIEVASEKILEVIQN